MKRGPTILAFALLFSACTRNNLEYTGDGGLFPVLGHDLAGVSPPHDLAGADLRGAAVLDFATAPSSLDLAVTDGPSTCSDGACPCGCSGGHCIATGAACGTGRVCLAGGCHACGAAGQPCCAGATCSGGSCCGGDSCVPSGRSCGNTTTTKICLNGTCSACGAHAQPCCADDACAPSLSSALGVCCDVTTRNCVANGETCGTTTCGLSGSCGGCGGTGIGQTCCPGTNNGPSLCSASKTTCVLGSNSDSCKACGTTGAACCDGNSCDNGGCCVENQCHASGSSCTNGLGTCSNGSCGTCGGLGQSCCNGDTCTATDTLCAGNKCVACGGQGQPCCADPSGGDGVFDYCARPFAPMTSGSGACSCG